MRIIFLLLALTFAVAGAWRWRRYEGSRTLLLFVAAAAAVFGFIANPTLHIPRQQSGSSLEVIGGAVLLVLVWARIMVVLYNRVHFHEAHRWMVFCSVVALLLLGGLGQAWFSDRASLPHASRSNVDSSRLQELLAWNAAVRPRAGPPAPTAASARPHKPKPRQSLLTDAHLRGGTLLAIAKERLRKVQVQAERKRRAHRRVVRHLRKRALHFWGGYCHWWRLRHPACSKPHHAIRRITDAKWLRRAALFWRHRRNHTKASVKAWLRRRAARQRAAAQRQRRYIPPAPPAAPVAPSVPVVPAPVPVATAAPAPAPAPVSTPVPVYHAPAPQPSTGGTSAPKPAPPPSTGGTSAPKPDPAPTHKGPQPDPYPLGG